MAVCWERKWWLKKQFILTSRYSIQPIGGQTASESHLSTISMWLCYTIKRWFTTKPFLTGFEQLSSTYRINTSSWKLMGTQFIARVPTTYPWMFSILDWQINTSLHRNPTQHSNSSKTQLIPILIWFEFGVVANTNPNNSCSQRAERVSCYFSISCLATPTIRQLLSFFQMWSRKLSNKFGKPETTLQLCCLMETMRWNKKWSCEIGMIPSM